MKRVFNIQVQRADDGFIAIAQSDTGVPTKKVVATSEEDIKTKVKDFVDHMFDEPPPKKDKEAKPSGPEPTANG